MAGLIRAVEAAGGFATVVNRGERDGGTILIVTMQRGRNARIFERMPSPDGQRNWHTSFIQDTDKEQEIDKYLNRRRMQDPDLWIVELDIANGERFIGLN